jgi:hypothetical protein
MQDNNNINNLTNGDTRSPDRFANIRAAEERKLLARNNGHNSKKIIMDQVTNIPIPEDENEDADKNSGHESGGTASTPVDADNTDSVLLKDSNQKRTNHPRQALEAIYTHYEISKKSRIPFLVLSVACLILLLVVIILAIVWPYIPSYMRADVCVDPECFDASRQVSLSSLFLRGCLRAKNNYRVFLVVAIFGFMRGNDDVGGLLKSLTDNFRGIYLHKPHDVYFQKPRKKDFTILCKIFKLSITCGV